MNEPYKPKVVNAYYSKFNYKNIDCVVAVAVLNKKVCAVYNIMLDNEKAGSTVANMNYKDTSAMIGVLLSDNLDAIIQELEAGPQIGRDIGKMKFKKVIVLPRKVKREAKKILKSN